jgi:AbrB family looped-hinge helix DNA binding protein
MADRTEVTIGPEGRVLIPARIRRAAGMEPGASVVVQLEGERVVLTARDAIKHHLQHMFSGVDGSMAEDLIAERRAEVRRELPTE